MRTKKKVCIDQKTKQKKISLETDIQLTSPFKSVNTSVFWLADSESVKLCSVTVPCNKIISSKVPKGARGTIRLFLHRLTIKPEREGKSL